MPQKAHPAGSPSGVVIPFTGAAHEHQEPINTQVATPAAAAQRFGPIDVPAYGFLRHILFEVSGTGGVIGTGAAGADYPFNLFQSVALYDVNGAPIFGPLDGFATLQANLYGGYGFRQDPRLDPDYAATFATPTFLLRIPVEISRHNGLGSLANQNAAASYKLEYTVNTFAAMMATVGTATAPTFTIKTWLEAWSLPNAKDLANRPQAQVPPAHGTSQYWSAFTKSGIVVGNNNVLLPRVGNLIRVLICIGRDATGARADGVFPDPGLLMWDARVLTNESQRVRRKRQSEALMQGATRDTGVFAYLFDNYHSGQAGDEEPNLWLPTVQSTRLELQGTSAVAGTQQWITNDIAPVEVLPAARFVESSATGFHPQIGSAAPAAA